MNSFTGTSSHIQVHSRKTFFYYYFASITRKIENNGDTFKSYNTIQKLMCAVLMCINMVEFHLKLTEKGKLSCMI